MTSCRLLRTGAVGLLACGFSMSTGCSGPTEDVRVTLCKHLTQSLVASAGPIEWQDNKNIFKRPEYVITALSYEVAGDNGRGAGRSACHYAYEALDDTALNLANPLDAYDTLPFAMTVDGRALSDKELLAAVNAEQRRQGRRVLDILGKGTGEMADKVRATIAN